MWKNFKALASEALEAAKDIKEHLGDVTSGEYDLTEDDNIYQIRAKHYQAQFDKTCEKLKEMENRIRDLQAIYQREKIEWKRKKNELEQKVKEAKQDFQSRGNTYQIIVQELNQKVQEIGRARTQLSVDLQQSQKALAIFQSQNLKQETSKIEFEELKKKYQESLQSVEEGKKQIVRIKKLLEEEKRSNRESVNRVFVIQFLSSFQQVLDDEEGRREMMESLVGILHLNQQQKAQLNISKRVIKSIAEEEEELSLLEKFTRFISDN